MAEALKERGQFHELFNWEKSFVSISDRGWELTDGLAWKKKKGIPFFQFLFFCFLEKSLKNGAKKKIPTKLQNNSKIKDVFFFFLSKK